MKLSIALALLASATAEAHCKFVVFSCHFVLHST